MHIHGTIYIFPDWPIWEENKHICIHMYTHTHTPGKREELTKITMNSCSLSSTNWKYNTQQTNMSIYFYNRIISTIM